MSTIENNFAQGTAAVGGAFSGSILGQANRINTLQNNGIAAAGGGGAVNFAGNGTYMVGDRPALPQVGAAPIPQPQSVEQGIAMLQRDPTLIPQAIQALQDPQVLRQLLSALQQKPELVQALPLQIQQFLHFLLSGGTGGCGAP